MITDPKEHEILQYLLRTKKWNPYCIRHSAITYDSFPSRVCFEKEGTLVNEFKAASTVHQKAHG
jgi:hypothetical protein